MDAIGFGYKAEDVTVGVGGAIVALSDPQEEVDEMLLKSRATVKALSETTLTRREPVAAVARPSHDLDASGEPQRRAEGSR